MTRVAMLVAGMVIGAIAMGRVNAQGFLFGYMVGQSETSNLQRDLDECRAKLERK